MKKFLAILSMLLSFNVFAESLSGTYLCEIKNPHSSISTVSIDLQANEGKTLNIMGDKIISQAEGTFFNTHGMNEKLLQVSLQHSSADENSKEQIFLVALALDTSNYEGWANFNGMETAQKLSEKSSVKVESSDGLVSVKCSKK